MPKLIDRQLLLAYLAGIKPDEYVSAFGEAAVQVIGLIEEFVKEMPTIEPEVRHGRWIPTGYDSYADGAPVWDEWECSECGHEHSGEEDTLTAFCPDCGAKMYADGETISKERFAEIMGGADDDKT